MNDYLNLPADLPVPEDDGAANHRPGRRMPHLELPGTAGEGSTSTSSARAAQCSTSTRSPVVPAPTSRRSGTRSPERGLHPRGVQLPRPPRGPARRRATRVRGLSSQDTDYQREVVERLRLPFQMLSDPALALAGALDLPTPSSAG
ncbi:hypothetical protein [Saccharopolyspora sp. ASAGF58]|uniref:hypothetical protein n=1 Tax=Saccharopolyspora sp. ASAGF58 TaxID=2719023 RepID=UPI001FF0B9B9|nr:hypothetical protein [Saccharopolyspora sp. ASAGF58]